MNSRQVVQPPVINDEMASRVVEQAFEFWINPEIERRRSDGRLPDDFTLQAAQIIFNVDADAPEVRLNGEVEALAQAKAKRDIEKGEAITHDDIEGIEEIFLTDHDPNAAHMTLIARPGGWWLAFDFEYNAARIADHIAAAEEFLDASREAQVAGRQRVFVDNLLSAVELMAKAFLISTPDKTILTTKRHGIIQARFNQTSKLGNVESRFAQLLNKLYNLRRPARYLSRDFEITAEEMGEMLQTGYEMFEALGAASPRRISMDA